MSDYILGIDPGWSGGAVVLDDAGRIVALESFAGKTEPEIINLVRNRLPAILANGFNPACYIEKVGPMPKQGVVSVFKFGWINGLLRGLVIGAVPVFEVRPQVWQKALGCLTRGDKNISKAKAQMLFPSVYFTHATADAALIAYYGYTKERNIQPEEKHDSARTHRGH